MSLSIIYVSLPVLSICCQDKSVARLKQIGLRKATRQKLKRPAAAIEDSPEKDAPKETSTPEPKKQGKKVATPAGTKKTPSPPKKAKSPKEVKASTPTPPKKSKHPKKVKSPKAKSTKKPKSSKSNKKAAKTRKGRKPKNGKTKATFARRVKPGREPSGSFWQSLRDAFENVVESKIRSPSTMEDPQLKHIQVEHL